MLTILMLLKLGFGWITLALVILILACFGAMIRITITPIICKDLGYYTRQSIFDKIVVFIGIIIFSTVALCAALPTFLWLMKV